jgi:hypothetical protein
VGSRYESDGILVLAYLSFVCKANIDAHVSTQDLDQNFLVHYYSFSRCHYERKGNLAKMMSNERHLALCHFRLSFGKSLVGSFIYEEHVAVWPKF